VRRLRLEAAAYARASAALDISSKTRKPTSCLRHNDSSSNGEPMNASKEDRIAARRLRIQQKLAMKQGEGAAGSTGAAITMHEKTDVRIGK